jgi:hypothetical protein
MYNNPYVKIIFKGEETKTEVLIVVFFLFLSSKVVSCDFICLI